MKYCTIYIPHYSSNSYNITKREPAMIKLKSKKLSREKVSAYLDKALENNLSEPIQTTDDMKFIGEALVKAKEHNCSVHRTITLELNTLMQSIMEMDFVKQMLLEVQEQKQMVQTISAASEESAAAIEQISALVQESVQFTVETTKVADGGKTLSKETLEKIHSAYENISKAHKMIMELNDEAKDIDSLIAIISSVADQTNILAINASIEAARSGAAGSGFAVVASEIKKLAQSSAESVKYIGEKLNAMQSGIAGSSDFMKIISESFVICRTDIDELFTSVDKIDGSVVKINENMQQIMSSVEEQTAAVEEISSSLEKITENAESLHEHCLRTGKGFYDISEEINRYRARNIDMSDCERAADTINYCITDHLHWKWRIYNLLLGYEKLNAEDVGNHHTCRLGKWIEANKSVYPKLEGLIRDMEKPHSELHKLAGEAIKLYNQGKKHQADEMLVNIDMASAEVVVILKKMLEIVG